MARTALLLGFPLNGGEPVLLAGPTTPIGEIKQAMKQAKTKRADDTFARLEMWESGAGLVSYVTFSTPTHTSQEAAPTVPPVAPATAAAQAAYPAPAAVAPSEAQLVNDEDGPSLLPVTPTAHAPRRK